MDRKLLMPCIDGVLQVGVAYAIGRVQRKNMSIGLMLQYALCQSAELPTRRHCLAKECEEAGTA